MNPSELADKWLNGTLGRDAVYINEETAYSVAEQLVCQIRDADEKHITKIIARLLAKPTTCCGHPIVEPGSGGYLGQYGGLYCSPMCRMVGDNIKDQICNSVEILKQEIMRNGSKRISYIPGSRYFVIENSHTGKSVIDKDFIQAIIKLKE